MVVMKKLKTFEVVFSDPSKAFYCSGDKVAGNVVVEVSEVTKVSVLKVLGVGCGKVEYAKGKQKCREEIDYLKYEEVVHLDQQTRGKGNLKVLVHCGTQRPIYLICFNALIIT